MNNKCVEYTIVKIKTREIKSLFIIISMYATNAEKRKQIFIDELEHLFLKLKFSEKNNYYIIMGDLNARHTDYNDSINNYRERYLRHWELAHFDLMKLNIIPSLT